MNQDTNPTPNTYDLMVEALSKYLTYSIVLPSEATADTLTAAAALRQALVAMGKTVFFASTTPHKIDVYTATPTIGASGDSLTISFPYTDGSIDKVDYKIEQGKFNLIVIPRPGFPKVTQDQLTYTYGGGSIDVIITLGVPSLESLGTLYTDNQATVDAVPVIINIDQDQANTQYGNINHIIPGRSLAQIVYTTLLAIGAPMDPRVATSLYASLMQATNNLTDPSVTPETYEYVAQLLRAGATRQPQVAGRAPATAAPQPRSQPQQPPRQAAQQTQLRQQQTAPRPQAQATQPPRQQQAAVQQPQARQQQPQPKRPQQATPVTKSRPETASHAPQPQEAKSWLDTVESTVASDPADAEGTQEKSSGMHTDSPFITPGNQGTPQDWLKPKIFKGNGLV